ncbi:site-2 protease family protein [Micrococcales bacterium 31B]|nr:site-2 protease family protein [Micrococcales bacterium 31B]
MPTRPPLKRGTVAFHCFGFLVKVEPTTWLVLAVILLLMVPSGAGLSGVSATLVFAVVIYGLGILVSVLLHELAHAVTARALGHRVTEIALHFWGGHTQFHGESRTWWHRIAISLCGPLTNVALAVVTYLVAAGLEPSIWRGLVLLGWCYINAVMAAINLLPVSPLDGGHALTAVLEKVTGSERLANRIAATLGLLLGAGLAVVGVIFQDAISTRFGTTGVIWVVLGGAYLAFTAYQAFRHDAQLQRVRDFSWRPLARPCVLGAPGAALAEYAGDLLQGARVVLADDQGQLVGIVDDAAFRAVPAHAYGQVALSAVSRQVGPAAAFPAAEDGTDALAHILENTEREYLAVDAAGLPVAVIDRAVVHAFWTQRTRG